MVHVGIIGLGWMGQLHARYLSTIEYCEVTAVCDQNEKILREMGEKYHARTYVNYKEMLECDDIDTIYIVTPQKYHFQIARDVIAADKHMLCEKPLALTQQEVDELRKLAASSTKKIIVDFVERFSISTQEAMEEIRRGAVGDIQFIRGNFRFSMKHHANMHGTWVFDRSQGGGLILESSVHLWDTVRFMTGKEVESVVAVAHNNATANFEDSFACIAYLTDGVIACIDMSGWLPENAATDKRFEIIGSEGCIYLDEFRNYMTIQSEKGVENNPGMFTTGMTHKDLMWHSSIAGGVKRLSEHFIDCIRKDKKPLVGIEDGARACEITWSVIKSLQSGKMEKVHYGN